MKYHIIETNGNLVLTIDEDERRELLETKKEDPKQWGTLNAEIEALEPLISNSELAWVHPEETGDLTDAPMLGILGEEVIRGDGELPSHYGTREVGRSCDVVYIQPIIHRWAYMDYQIRSFLDDLIDHGRAVFIGA